MQASVYNERLVLSPTLSDDPGERSKMMYLPMDKLALAAKMKRFQLWMDEACCYAERQLAFKSSPHGSCYLSISRTTQTAPPTQNLNRINLCGLEEGLTATGLEDLFDIFRAEAIVNFNVWLSPGPDMDEIRSWLREAGFAFAAETRYPVMCYTGASETPVRTDLAIREVGPNEVAQAKPILFEPMWDGYFSSAGKPGFHHFLAFDGSRPVAHAALALFENLAYLGWMSTDKKYRRRGAQQALIALRVAKAKALGASVIVVETLTTWHASYSNLQRAGFRELYEKELYTRRQA